MSPDFAILSREEEEREKMAEAAIGRRVLGEVEETSLDEVCQDHSITLLSARGTSFVPE